MSAVQTLFDIDIEGDLLKLVAKGDWRAPNLGQIDGALRDFEDDSMGRDLLIDVSAVERMDTAGAMVLQRVLRACQTRGERSRIIGAAPPHAALLEQVGEHIVPCPVEPARGNAFVAMLNRLGQGAVEAYFASLEVLSFVGFALSSAARVMANPSRIRWTSVVYHMEEAGLNAVPIIGLMSFLIGAVVAFMGAKILRQFGAEIFTVELVGISVLREFGVLLAAILIAGRSGSAFTAQIGTMKIREEIDALRVLGLDPMEVLVLPRLFALVIMLPALAFLAAMLGLIGGGLVAWSSLGISPVLFITRMQETIVMSNFWAGIIKAPFFAFAIAIIGCFQGTEVKGSAESLGQRVTLSVVQALFLVILLDAFFAMFFLEIDF
ncbi:MlaE family lipid ABC transporter permease subunit [Amphiplicatus metriothermophilus]|uniref:Phospholipid/cholesterol/gamma-HCH transport system permease protein n=1 Tax=Amphiplicatus metriothermophilus TaxID=1519374 RepID=A0A239PRA4_9PROT|nr:MlaE family lipid ABC transporter permease subunit [Amphiplicatus metriothermophilus]MBB5518383.1 phospholipid/cholesterol/gamma-HCH transport system permease protein [Amphiplicatus metriothermophilus]SNT72452.1 phospholipid/cholesterol/gamma-HCH transport system permease protein [Amphiplicatus metriothermophilus]